MVKELVRRMEQRTSENLRKKTLKREGKKWWKLFEKINEVKSKVFLEYSDV